MLIAISMAIVARGGIIAILIKGLVCWSWQPLGLNQQPSDLEVPASTIHPPPTRTMSVPQVVHTTTGLRISGLLITGEACGFDFEQEHRICPTVQVAGQIDDGHCCNLRA